MKMQSSVSYSCNRDLKLKATDLRLGLPGLGEDENEKQSPSVIIRTHKRCLSEMEDSSDEGNDDQAYLPPIKAQVTGWPPVSFYKKSVFYQQETNQFDNSSGMYVKISMDGAPYLRKIDLKFYNNYSQLLRALENMFNCTIRVYSEREGYNGSEFAPTYEDKDGDWMLVGDVPWNMFVTSCRKLRLMKGLEAKGLGYCI